MVYVLTYCLDRRIIKRLFAGMLRSSVLNRFARDSNGIIKRGLGPSLTCELNVAPMVKMVVDRSPQVRAPVPWTAMNNAGGVHDDITSLCWDSNCVACARFIITARPAVDELRMMSWILVSRQVAPRKNAQTAVLGRRFV